MKNCALGAFALAGVARAAPQRVGIGIVPVPAFPITNATITPKPTPTGTGLSCEASCEVQYPELYGITWIPEDQISFTETITVGTVSILTSIIDNYTKVVTDTVYDDMVPWWHTLYRHSTNPAGTKYVEADITLSDGPTTTTFAYPTPWVDYPSQYHWQGVLPTIDKRYEPTCVTSLQEDGGGMGEVTPHPLYPQPTDVFLDKKDPEGMNYVPLWIAFQDDPDKKWFDDAFPSESAYVYCASVPGKKPPALISTAKFVLSTATFVTSMKSPGLIHVESTVTGFEATQTKTPPDLQSQARDPKSSSVPQRSPVIQPPETPTPGIPSIVSTVHMESAVSRDDTPLSARPTLPPAPTRSNAPGLPGPAPTLSNGNGAVHSAAAQHNGKLGQPAPAPIFTFTPTTVDGRPTATPVFLLPSPSTTATATLGQTVVFNDQTTVLTVPTAIFAIVPTVIAGVATSTPAYIISGTSTASIGQTLTFDGQTTVLAAPAPFETLVATTLFGVATRVTAYIISGSVTAFPGQTVTRDGVATTLPTADAVFTGITTTLGGRETVVPGWVISGSVTATVGQTITVAGAQTVLSLPTPTADAIFTAITTRVDGRQTVVSAYIVSGSVTATLGQTVTLDGTPTVLSAPTETGKEVGGEAQVEGVAAGWSARWNLWVVVVGMVVGLVEL